MAVWDDEVHTAQQNAQSHRQLPGGVQGEDQTACQAQETGEPVESEQQLHHLRRQQPRRARPVRARHQEVRRADRVLGFIADNNSITIIYLLGSPRGW